MPESHLVGDVDQQIAKKVEKVLGIPPEELATHQVEALIEELCDTALMFDQEAKDRKKPAS